MWKSFTETRIDLIVRSHTGQEAAGSLRLRVSDSVSRKEVVPR